MGPRSRRGRPKPVKTVGAKLAGFDPESSSSDEELKGAVPPPPQKNSTLNENQLVVHSAIIPRVEEPSRKKDPSRPLHSTVLALFLSVPRNPRLWFWQREQYQPLRQFGDSPKIFTANDITFLSDEKLPFFIMTLDARENGFQTGRYTYIAREMVEGLTFCLVPDDWTRPGFVSNFTCTARNVEAYTDLAIALSSLVSKQDFEEHFTAYAKEIKKFTMLHFYEKNLADFCRHCPESPLSCATIVSLVISRLEPEKGKFYLQFYSDDELVRYFLSEAAELNAQNRMTAFFSLLKDSRLKLLLKAAYSLDPVEKRKAVLEFRSLFKPPRFAPMELEILRSTRSIELAADLCPSIKSAKDLVELGFHPDLVDVVMRTLITHWRVKDYRAVLDDMNEQDFLDEWKCFLSNPFAPIPEEPVFFLTKFSRDRDLHDKIRRICSIITKTIENHENFASPWAKLLSGQIVSCLKSLYDTTAILNFVNDYVKRIELVRLFLPLIPPVENDDLKIRMDWLHSFQSRDAINLSDIAKELMIQESKNIYRFVSFTSDEIRQSFKDGLVRKKYWTSPYYCHDDVELQGIPVYKHLWKNIFDVEAICCDTSNKRKFLSLLNDPTSSLVFEAIVHPRCCDLATELLFKAPYTDDVMKLKLSSDVNRFVDALETGEVTRETLDFFDLHSQRLQQLTKRNIQEMINRWTEAIRDAKAQWALLFDTMQILQERLKFRDVSLSKRTSFEKEYETFENRPVSEWTRPTGLDTQLRLMCERLMKVKKSLIFNYLWDQESYGDEIVVTEATLFDDWINYVKRYDREFHSIVGDFASKKVNVELVSMIFGGNFNGHVIQPMDIRMQLRDFRDVQLRGEFRRLLDSFENIVKEELHEVSTLTKIPIHDTTAVMVRQCLHGLSIQNDSKAFAAICDNYQLSGNAVQSNALFSICSPTENIEHFVHLYLDVLGQLRPLQEVLPRYFTLFREVLIQQRLLALLLSFPDLAAFNRRIDSKQSEDLTDEIGELLTSLRLIGQIVLNHPLSAELRRTTSSFTVHDLINFIHDCSSSYKAISFLWGKGTAAELVMQQATEEKQIIALVKSLLLSGSFVIEIKNRKVVCFGAQQDKTEISAEEFEALPSQLLLTSGVEVKSDAERVDDPLPENISKPQDRERYVQRFIVLFDRMIILSKLIQALCEAGFPDFQENRLSIPCFSIRIPRLDDEISKMKELLDSWIAAYSSMRQELPYINCFSRVQLVEWMRAFRSDPMDINTLHDTLVAVGCEAGESITAVLQDILKSFQDERQIKTVVSSLNTCFEICFPVKSLVEKKVPTAKGSNIMAATAASKLGKEGASLVHLLRLVGQSSEEEVVGFHIGHHKRVPFPFEIMFCSAQTSEVDLEDFIERWASFHRVAKRKDHCASFYLVHPNRISFDKQHRIARKISELQRNINQFHSDYKIPLFLVVETTNLSCYITNVFQRNELIAVKEECDQARKNIALALKNQKVYVVKSRSCSSGKTRSVIEKLVNPESNPQQLHTQITVDKSPVNASLIRLNRERPLKENHGIVLHFSIGHNASAHAVNVFLLEFILLGTWRDDKGASFSRHPKDTIAVELCNTGLKDESDRVRVTKHFTPLVVDSKISTHIYEPIPSDEHGSCRVFLENPHSIPLAAVIMLDVRSSWFTGDTNRLIDSSQPYVVMLDPQKMMTACYSDEQSGGFTQIEILWRDPQGDASGLEGICQVHRETVLYRYNYLEKDGLGASLLVHLFQIGSGVIPEIVSHSAVEDLPVPPSEELDIAVRWLSDVDEVPEAIQEIYLRRFFRFATAQLNNFYSSFGFWSIAEAMEERDYMLQLTYEYAMMLMANCKDLSKPTIMPQDMSNPQDDIARFKNMENFEKWMNRPYFICTPSSFQVLSTANFDPLQFIIEKNPNSDFSEWIKLQATLRPYDRQRVQNLCDQLASCPFSADSERPPLKDLLEIVGCFDGARDVIEAVDYVRNIPGTHPIFTVEERVLEVVNWLNSKTSNPREFLDMEDPVSKFKQVAESFLCRIFGNSEERPGFRLTVGSVLRLIAIQIRNICRIPICIVGETGCGKTEMLSFLAKLVGAFYHVINVQEGMNEEIFRQKLELVIMEAVLHPSVTITCVLDEANATSHVWLARDMLCDHILQSIRMPSNINFVVIMNPAKYKSPEYLAIEKEMSVGGLDFRKYQQTTPDEVRLVDAEHTKAIINDLVYQVNTADETLYSYVWDFGTAYQINSKREDVPEVSRHIVMDKHQELCSDELQLTLSMVDWLVKKLKAESQDLLDAFNAYGDASDGEAYFWTPFRTILIELILYSQSFIRRAYGGEASSISLRDIRNTCKNLFIIFQDFYGTAVELKPEIAAAHGKSSPFHLLTSSLHVSLVVVYCLRLDSTRRLKYLQEVHQQWRRVRDRFPRLERSFLPAPPPDPATTEVSDLYRSFDDLALLVVSDLLNDGEIAPNQALKENTFSMLLAIWTKSTLFIVGRPGSTKSRALELLCEASISGAKKKSFISVLGLTIYKFVVQCSPDTTAEHVNSQARRAAFAQNKQAKLTSGERHQCVLVLEEVGATIGSRHNPLMSLHQLIDHGVLVQIQGRWICERIPVIGISNYRLDASKMGRGSIVHRGNPAVEDLAMTARTILRHLDRTGSTDYTKMFSQAFNHNVLQDKTLNWYHGMRDFYASVSTIQRLVQPTKEFVGLVKPTRASRFLSSHTVRWAMLINFQGYPDTKEEKRLLKTMIDSFQLSSETPAVWEWCQTASATGISDHSMKLCDTCCRMQLYLKLIQFRTENPQEIITTEMMSSIFKKHATQITTRELPCEFFDHNEMPAVEIIAFSLWETSTRHQMIFTKANAALPLLFSLKLLRKEECTIIFNSLDNQTNSSSTSERVQQMMRIKACLREGKTLILVRSRHLYESLLDATNVHYLRDYSGDGEVLHRTMLSMAGVTQSVLIRPSFRCIVLEDQDELRDYVMPPFINRFAKTTLTFDSILSPAQRKTKRFLHGQSKVQIVDEKINEETEFNMFQAIAPGFSNFTIDSAAFVYEGEQEAFERIAHCFSRKNLRRLRLGLVANLVSRDVKAELAKIETKWRECGANANFIKRAVNLLQLTDEYVDDEEEEEEEIGDDDDDGYSKDPDWDMADPEEDNLAVNERDQPERRISHLMILTEQLQVDQKDLQTTLEQIISESDQTEKCHFSPSEIQLLNQMSAIDVTQALLQLKRSTVNENDESAVAVFVLDTEMQSIITLDTFSYLVSTTTGIGVDCKRVILIVTFKDTMSTENCRFNFVFHHSWAFLNTDEIISKPIEGITLEDEETLEYLEMEDKWLHEILNETLMTKLLLQEDVLIRICQLLPNPSDVERKIEITKKLLLAPSDLRSAIFRICHRSIEKEGITFERWASLAFQKSKRALNSLRAIYITYLTEFCAQVFLPILELLFRFGTIKSLERDESLNSLMSQILEILLPHYDVSSCLNIDAFPKIFSSDLVVGLMTFSKSTVVQLPFSPQLASLLSQDSPVGEQIIQIIQLHERRSFEWADLYQKDILVRGFSIAMEDLELFQLLVRLRFANAFDSITTFHQFLKENKAIFQNIRRFISSGLEPSAVENLLNKVNPTSVDAMELGKNFQGVPVLSRLELLRVILQEDPNISWKVYRAAGVAAQFYFNSEEAQIKVKHSMEQFQRSLHEGFDFTITNFPEITIFFLFELFNGGNEEISEQELNNLQILLNYCCRPNLQLNNEPISRCVGFILNRAFNIFIPYGSCEEPLEKFIAFETNVLFASHCLIDQLSERIEFLQLCEQRMRQLPQGQLRFFLESCTIVVCIWKILTNEVINEKHRRIQDLLSNMLTAILEQNRDLHRNAVLYALRQLTNMGTVDVEASLMKIRNHESLPQLLREHPLLNEVASALQKESPLAAMRGYSAAISALSEKVLGVAASEARLRTILPIPHTLAVSSLILNISPKDIPNFAAIKAQEIQRHGELKAFVQNLEGFVPQLPPSLPIRELILHGLALFLSKQRHAEVSLRVVRQSIEKKEQLRRFRLEVEESLVPHCPRCHGAIMDWTGCFAVVCQCGCGFCGVCLIDCGGDAHPHVLQVHGNYHFPFERFLQEFGAKAAQRIRAIVANTPVDLQDLIADELPRVLQGNRYQLQAANLIAPRGAGNHGPANQAAVPISASTRLLFEILGIIGHAYLRVIGEGRDEVFSWIEIAEKLEQVLLDLRISIFAGADSHASSIRWFHAAFSELFSLENRLIPPLPSIMDAQRHAEGILRQFSPDQLMQRLMSRFEEKNSKILQELTFNAAFAETEKNPLSALFLSRDHYYSEQFIEHISLNAGQFPLLYNITSRSSALTRKNLLANLRLIHFIRDLSNYAKERNITKEQAERISLIKFIEDNYLLKEQLQQFENDFIKIFTNIHRYECNQKIHQQFQHLLTPGTFYEEDTPLALFLPRKEGVGILARALYHGREGDSINDWTGLGNLQNEIVTTATSNQNAGIIFPPQQMTETLSPYEIQEDDLVICETKHYLYLLKNLFVIPDYHPHLITTTNDLPIMELLLRYGSLRLAFYPKLLPELPDHQYPLDSFSTLLEPLETMLVQRRKDFLPLPAVLQVAIHTLFEEAPNAIMSVFEYAVLSIKQLTTFQVNLPEFVRDILFTIPMTREQQIGQHILLQIPVIRSELRTIHLRSLLAACWDGTVHPSANNELDDDKITKEEFLKGFQFIVDHPQYHEVVPFLFTALRILGMSQCQEQLTPGMSETLIFDLIFDLLSPDVQDLLSNVCRALGGALSPLTYPFRHFLVVYNEAVRLLGKLELVEGEDLVANQREVQVVSSSIMRQFLTPTDSFREDNHKNSNNDSQEKGKKPKNQSFPVMERAVVAAIEEKDNEGDEVQAYLYEDLDLQWSKEVGRYQFH